MLAQGFKHGITPLQGAGRISTNTDDVLADRLLIEHGVEIDHAVYIG
jgi:hypothetical protein